MKQNQREEHKAGYHNSLFNERRDYTFEASILWEL